MLRYEAPPSQSKMIKADRNQTRVAHISAFITTTLHLDGWLDNPVTVIQTDTMSPEHS